MQLAAGILKFLFFPGLLFTAFCGCLALWLEGRMKTALHKGEGAVPRPARGGKGEAAVPSPEELVGGALSLGVLGVAGYMLLGIRGDLLGLLLLLSEAEVLPLFLLAGRGVEDAAYVPLALRTAFARLAIIACAGICVSLRSPGEFAAGLETLRGEGAFHALRLWGGFDLGLMLASFVCALLAFLAFLVGRPPCSRLIEGKAVGGLRGTYFLVAEGAERAVTLIFFIVLFLGYPWEGAGGVLLWAGAAGGVALLALALRAWVEGRDPVTLRKRQEAAALAALLALALAFAAVV